MGLISGEGSVERMLNGKHYNNATRVLKTLYDALTRCRTKQFRFWLLGKNNDLRKLTESRGVSIVSS